MAKTKKIWKYSAEFRQWRESKRLSQDELAILLGTNQPHIARIEKNGQYPTIDVVNAMKAHGFDFETGKVIQDQFKNDSDSNEIVKLRERVEVWKEAFTISQREIGSALERATACIERLYSDDQKQDKGKRVRPHLQLRDTQ